MLTAPVVLASLAYACTSLATLGLNPQQGEAGQKVTVTGRGFVPHGSETRSGQPVAIRFDSQRNPVLATATPSGTDGSFSVQITVPQVPAGNHVVISTQARNDGSVASGTPARQAFTVVAPAPAPRASTGAAPQQTAPAPATRPGTQAVVPGPLGTPAPAGAVVGQGSPASGQSGIGGLAPSSQGGPPGATGAAQGVAAPGAAPAPFGAPAVAPVGPRSMTTPAEGPSTLVAVLLVAAGMILSLGGTALVVAEKRGQTALAVIRRPRG